MLRISRHVLLLVLAYLTLASLSAALPAESTSHKNDRRLFGGPSNSWTCKFLNQCPKPSPPSPAPVAPAGKSQIVAAGNTPRPTPMAIWTIPFFPFPGPAKTTTITTTKTGTVTVTTSKTTTASVTSIATATKTVSGSTTQITSVTVIPSVTVVPVTTVLTTTQTVPVVSTITPAVPSTTTVATTTISNVVTTTTIVVPITTTTTTVAAVPTPAAPISDPTTPDQQAVVDMHNSYRSKHGVQLLTWNATLANFAQSQANRCVWGHSGGPYGENGASGVGFNLTMASATTMWYNEIQNYNFSQPGFSETTGHFTQLVWKSSSTIGCAIAQCTPAQLGFNWPYDDPAWNVWCEYSNLPGNVIGQFDTQVVPPVGVTLLNGMVPSTAPTGRSLKPPVAARSRVRAEREHS